MWHLFASVFSNSRSIRNIRPRGEKGDIMVYKQWYTSVFGVIKAFFYLQEPSVRDREGFSLDEIDHVEMDSFPSVREKFHRVCILFLPYFTLLINL